MNDHLSDEEAIATPSRLEVLAKSTLTKGRSLGPLTIRPMTAETLSYLFEVENFFIRGMKGERVSAQNANAIWSTAEFLYIHCGDPQEVRHNVWLRSQWRQAVGDFLGGPLNDPKLLSDALPLIEEMVLGYFAVQTEAIRKVKGPKVPIAGKEQARVGKQAT
jgi:hypothetical protein